MEEIKIRKKDYEKNIYRVYPMHRFLELLDIKRLTLVRPRLWNDPMESIIFESCFNFVGESSYAQKYKNNYYAQCWTFKDESFALWNEYAPLQNGIMVRTKLKALIECLNNHLNIDEADTLFIGMVDYMSLNSIKKWVRENSSYIERVKMQELNYGQVHSLFCKLDQYEHEKEIRVVFNSGGDDNINKKDLYQEIVVEPIRLFDRLLIDPRMPENIYEMFKTKLIEYGFHSKQITRSKLLDEKRLRKEFQWI